MSVGSPTPSLESLSGTPLGSLIDSDPPRSLENSPPASTTGLWSWPEIGWAPAPQLMYISAVTPAPVPLNMISLAPAPLKPGYGLLPRLHSPAFLEQLFLYFASSSRVHSGSIGGRSSPLGTVCSVCNETFVMPRVLSCFHVFCIGCVEKLSDGGDRIICPQCHAVTPVPPSLLIPDYALHRLLEAPIDQPASCTACKSRDIAAVARCLDCSKLLCPHCVMAHQFMHCFEGHRVVTLAELAQRDERPVTCLRHKGEPLKSFCVTCSTPVCMDCTLVDHPKGMHEYESIQEAAPRHIEQIYHSMEDGKNRASDLRTCVKSIENSASRLQQQYDKAQSDIQEAFNFYTTMVEERKSELMRELDSLYHAKQVSLSVFAQKAQECIDKLLATCGFVEKMRKYANATELLMFRKLIDAKLGDLMSKNFDLGMQNVSDLEFVSNFSAIQVGVRNTFGYIRSASDIQVGPTKLPPIARPNSSHSVSSMNSINSCLNGLSGLNPISTSLNGGITNGHISNGHHVSNALTTSLSNGLTSSLHHSIPNNGVPNTLSGIPNGLGNGIANGLSSALNSTLSSTLNGNLNGVLERPYTNSQLSSLLSKRFNTSQNLGPFSSSTSLADLNLNGISSYEKWSSGEGGVFNQEGVNGLNQPDPILHDLSTKLLSCSIFPPRSQIKRQKMIYHCKFGEFGVLEGQFTEPSGVAVNAQNDIIVADTNNHRIQIFDKEGRFKFQFGECGKRDGQLLYPNRVAVVRTSGDIIVTERSPTHQIQIYNQYGQFVRKFGANTLCYPRGVTVDNKGRIIVVECKVMRVIIFDQYGTVLHQFNCPNHLEFPNGVVVNDKQEIFISDNRAHCVKVFNYEGQYLRQIGGEGITNYPIGVGINTQGEILIADNHNNFNLTLFTQDGQLVSAYESKVKHAQCFDVALMDDGSVVLASKDYRLYVYRYLQVPPPHI